MKTHLTNLKTAVGVTGACLLAAGAAHADSLNINRSYLGQLYFDQMRVEAQDWDIQDSNYLQGAGVNAVKGGAIAPRDWRDVPVVSSSAQELEQARVKLNYAISSGAANSKPRAFSHALVAYDCWVGQQKAELNASHNLSRCRDTYYRYAQELPEPMTTKTVTVNKDVPVTLKQLHKVYFEWDRHDLSQDAKTKLDQARETLLNAGNGKLVIGGHADASGSREYNMELSRKRAQSVADYLGLTSDRYEIDVHAYGEDRLQVPTTDGVREPGNRVAIIGIRTVEEVSVPVQVTTTVPVQVPADPR